MSIFLKPNTKMSKKKIQVLVEDMKEYGLMWNLGFYRIRIMNILWGYYHKYWLHKGKLNPFVGCGHINPYRTLWNDLQDLRGTDFNKLI